jgi:hypothetical protein
LLTAHNTCALLSVRGVTSVVTTQWHTTQKWNAQLLFELHELMNSNKTPSEALQYPHYSSLTIQKYLTIVIHIRQTSLTALFPALRNASSANLPPTMSRGQSRLQIHEQHLQQLIQFQQPMSLQASYLAQLQTHDQDSHQPSPLQPSPTPTEHLETEKTALPVSKDYLLKIAKMYLLLFGGVVVTLTHKDIIN